jgi:flagellar basal-body rod protein FlgF/flagellar basal-body rod protein FlgG
MPYGLYISAAGAHAQSQRVEVLSNNIANAQTPGFKRELAVLQARHSEAISEGQDYPGTRSINNLGGGVYMAETLTDFNQGVFKLTGIESDLAIEGDGFFQVEKNGQRLLTRAGNFNVGSDGRLLTSGNAQVLSDSMNAALWCKQASPSAWLLSSRGRLATCLRPATTCFCHWLQRSRSSLTRAECILAISSIRARILFWR